LTTDRVAVALAALHDALHDAHAVDLSFIEQPLDEHGWAGAPDLLRFLHALVRSLEPRHVLEFGSGVSTLVLAHAAAGLEDPCAITSVDHDPRFAAATAELLGAEATTVALQCAPLAARVRAGRLAPCYLVDQGLLGADRAADLILVDGPPLVLGGRGGMLPQALEYAQCGSIILFDDADRDGERDAIAHWEEQLGNAVEVHRPDGFVRGLAAVILAAPTTAQIRLAPRAVHA
jgi:predicted O-methyltransferase YrrM